MHTRTIKIGNMCCGRCVSAVEQILARLSTRYTEVDLGSVKLHETADYNETELGTELKKAGFKLIKGEDEELSEKIKVAINRLFQGELKSNDLTGLRLRNYLEENTQVPYKKISELFSRQNKKTIENYFILRRIEEAKRMIHDSAYSFSEIAARLGYNSLSYLSKQFKSSEGISMTEYRSASSPGRKHIDKL